MKKILYSLIGIFFINQQALADWWILQWVSAEKLRSGDINTDDIPKIIMWATDFLMGVAGTVALIFIIIGAYKIAIGSATENSTAEWKKTVLLALWGFILASLSWIIFKVILDNFT